MEDMILPNDRLDEFKSFVTSLDLQGSHNRLGHKRVWVGVRNSTHRIGGNEEKKGETWNW